MHRVLLFEALKLHQLLAEIASREERDETLRRALQPLDNRLLVAQLPGGEARAEVRERFLVAVLPVEDDHALHADAIDENRAQRLVGVGLRRAVLGDEAADDHAREEVHPPEHRVEDLAADVLVVDVDSLRASLAQIVVQSTGAVIHARIESELAHDIVALLAPARDAD